MGLDIGIDFYDELMGKVQIHLIGKYVQFISFMCTYVSNAVVVSLSKTHTVLFFGRFAATRLALQTLPPLVLAPLLFW